MIKGKRLLLVLAVLAMCYLLSFLAKTGTAAWFVSETEAKGSLINTVTDDLISVTSTVVSCENGLAQVSVSVTNQYEIDIPIQVQENHYLLLPAETYTEVISKKIPEEGDKIQIPLSGLNNYIEEMIEVSVDCYHEEAGALLESGENAPLKSENQNNVVSDKKDAEHGNK